MSYVDQQLLTILHACDKEQLTKYLNDEEAADLLVKSLDQYQELVREKETLQLGNKRLAESNLNKEPLVERHKSELSAAIGEFEQAKRAYVALKESFDAQTSVNGDSSSLDAIYHALHALATHAEEKVDLEAEEFFAAAAHTDEELTLFQKRFIESKTLAHIYKIKAEKMKELLPAATAGAASK